MTKRAAGPNDPRVTVRATRVWTYWCSFPIDEWPSMRATAKALGMSPASVNRARQELEKLGYVGGQS